MPVELRIGHESEYGHKVFEGLQAVLENLSMERYCGVVLDDGHHVSGGRIAPVSKSELARFGIDVAGLAEPVQLVMRVDGSDGDHLKIVTHFEVIPWPKIAKVFQNAHGGFPDLLAHFEKM